MKRASATAIVVLLLAGSAVWLVKQGAGRNLGSSSGKLGPPSAAIDGATETPTHPVAVPPDPDGVAQIRSDHRLERLADGRTLVTEAVKTARALHARDAEPETDLELVDSIFGLYRWAYKENPEGGDNRELVSALTGENPHQLIFIAPDHPSLGAGGELLDRWGTPYFFHKISDQVIDVTSAGPDKRLWSRDDLTLGYTESHQANTSG